MQRSFVQVDVFGRLPLLGNPVAVVLDAEGLSTEEMQRFASWTNLSETTFVLPPQDPSADYAVRIFMTTGELPFAGHPTLGTCHAVLEARGELGRDTAVQECAAGLVRLRRITSELSDASVDVLAFAGPPLCRSGPVDPGHRARLADQLGIAASDVLDAAWADNGPGWVAVLLDSAESVAELCPRRVEEMIGVAGLHAPGGASTLEVRAFCPAGDGYFEDPVTGSLNASLARWLLDSGRLEAPYIATQGSRVGRDGRVLVHAEDSSVWVGGRTATVVRGAVTI